MFATVKQVGRCKQVTVEHSNEA